MFNIQLSQIHNLENVNHGHKIEFRKLEQFKHLFNKKNENEIIVVSLWRCNQIETNTAVDYNHAHKMRL